MQNFPEHLSINGLFETFRVEALSQIDGVQLREMEKAFKAGAAVMALSIKGLAGQSNEDNGELAAAVLIRAINDYQEFLDGQLIESQVSKQIPQRN